MTVTANPIRIYQKDHGFRKGQPVVLDVDTGLYKLAIADTEDNARVIGVVNTYITPDYFVLSKHNDELIRMVGLVPGTVYYLSDTIAGEVTILPPANFVREIYQATTEVRAKILLNFISETTAGPPPTEGGAPVDAAYILAAIHPDLPNGRKLTAGTGISISLGTAGTGNATIASTITQYTDEAAQDAVGGMVIDTDTIDLTYNDATPSLKAEVKNNSIDTVHLVNDAVTTAKINNSAVTTAKIDNDAVTFAKMQEISDETLLGNDSGGTANPQEITLGTDLEFNGSGSIRHTASALAAGTYYYPGGSFGTDNQGHVIAAVSDPFSNGEGRVFGRSSTARAITTGAFIYYSADLDKFYIGTTAANGVLHTIDMILKESYVLATYTAKVLINAIYSPNSGLLYLAYGATLSMSVNATTGAAVTTGIAAGMSLGAAIRPSDGVIYGGNSGSGNINRINSTTDTAGSAITLSARTLNSNSRKAITHCSDNDSIYAAVGSGASAGIARIDCTTNVETATFNCAGMTGGSGAASCVWSPYAGKIYAAIGASNKLSQIDPSSDSEEANYAFPTGVASGIGSNGIVCLGRYLYMGCPSASTPNEILVFDTLDNVFVGSLNTANGAATDGRCMDGKAGIGIDDTFLLHGTSGVAATNWFIFGGRI